MVSEPSPSGVSLFIFYRLQSELLESWLDVVVVLFTGAALVLLAGVVFILIVELDE